jgi:hypothetical protein
MRADQHVGSARCGHWRQWPAHYCCPRRHLRPRSTAPARTARLVSGTRLPSSRTRQIAIWSDLAPSGRMHARPPTDRAYSPHLRRPSRTSCTPRMPRTPRTSADICAPPRTAADCAAASTTPLPGRRLSAVLCRPVRACRPAAGCRRCTRRPCRLLPRRLYRSCRPACAAAVAGVATVATPETPASAKRFEQGQHAGMMQRL